MYIFVFYETVLGLFALAHVFPYRVPVALFNSLTTKLCCISLKTTSNTFLCARKALILTELNPTGVSFVVKYCYVYSGINITNVKLQCSGWWHTERGSVTK